MIPADVEIYVALQPIDMRLSFDLLSGLVRDRMRGDPKNGSIYVFFGKRKDKLKALFYDRSGFCILYKRLCRGTFRIPEAMTPDGTSVRLEEEELLVLLEGLGVAEKKPTRRETRKPSLVH
jgi:transposase